MSWALYVPHVDGVECIEACTCWLCVLLGSRTVVKQALPHKHLTCHCGTGASLTLYAVLGASETRL